MVSRNFSTLDIISALHQRVTGSDITTPDALKRHLVGRSVSHALDYREETAHYLGKMFPDLLDVDFSGIQHGVKRGSAEMEAWQRAQILKYGETRAVPSVKDWLEAHPEDVYKKAPERTWANLPGRIMDTLATISLHQ